MIVALLTERSFQTPEDPGSNPVISKRIVCIYALLSVCTKDKYKEEREAGNEPFFVKKTEHLNFLERNMLQSIFLWHEMAKSFFIIF